MSDLHKQIIKTCLDLTSPLPKNKLNGPLLNELIILSEFCFYLETNDIILENVNATCEQVYNKVILLQKVSEKFLSTFFWC